MENQNLNKSDYSRAYSQAKPDCMSRCIVDLIKVFLSKPLGDEVSYDELYRVEASSDEIDSGLVQLQQKGIILQNDDNSFFLFVDSVYKP